MNKLQAGPRRRTHSRKRPASLSQPAHLPRHHIAEEEIRQGVMAGNHEPAGRLVRWKSDHMIALRAKRVAGRFDRFGVQIGTEDPDVEVPHELPEIVQQLIEQRPDVWDAYNKLGQAAGETGPLDEKTEQLVKLATAVGGGLEGDVRSHTRRGRAM